MENNGTNSVGSVSASEEHRLQRLHSSSSDTGGDPKGNRSSSDAGRNTNRDTSSTDVSSQSFWEDRVSASPQGRSPVGIVSSDNGTTTSITCDILQIGNNNAIYLPRREDELYIQRTQFLDEFDAVSDLFVETNGYIDAKKKLDENQYVLLTGCSGEGKSFIARKLVCEKIKAGYSVIPVDRINQWQERVKWRQKQVVFLDDMLGRIHSDNKETEYKELITHIDSVITEGMGSEKCSMLLVMTCRKSYLPKISQYLRCKSIFHDNKVVDLSSPKLTLSMTHRLEILKKHLLKYRSKCKPERKFLDDIVSSKCPVGYPNCVSIFTRNDNLFKRGSKFFESPTEYVHQEILRIYETDADIYALLLFLLVREGEIQTSTLNRICNETLEFPLLQSIANLPSRQIGTRFHSALKRIDETFVVQEGINVRFSHSCVLEAVCLSFSLNLQHEAIKWLPFQFIFNRIRPHDFEGSVDEEHVKIGEPIYDDLAERFLKEIEIGNILAVFKHDAMKSPKFVLNFIEVLQQLSSNDCKRLSCILQISEHDSERGALFNGSLLYWSASLGLKHLCSLLLERRFYDIIEDKYWVRVQASAALVPACWYGFDTDTLDLLFSLGACINSSMHQDRRSQTHFCDYCTVHDEDGMTTIQSTVYGKNSRKNTTLQYLFDKGTRFNVNSVNRPLIKIILKYNEFRSEGKDNEAQNVLQTIKILLDHGIDVNLKDSHERTALIYAVANDNIEIVELLLTHMKKSSKFYTQQVLPYAKSETMVSILESQVIDKDFTQKDNHGKTLLHRVNHKDLVIFFIKKGCQINQRDKDGRTPLFYATTVDILDEMVKRGASLMVRDADDKNILHFTKFSKIAEYVLKTCRPPDSYKLITAKDKWGRTPLFTTVDLDLASIFILNKADVNYQAPDVFKASESESVRVVEQLGSYIYGYDKNDKEQLGKNIHDSVGNRKNIICANFIQKHSDFVPVDQFSLNIDQTTGDGLSSYTAPLSKTDPSTSISVNSSWSNIELPEMEETLAQYTIAMKLARNGKLSADFIRNLIKSNVKFDLTDVCDNTVLHHLLTPDRRCKEILEILQIILDSEPIDKRISLVNTENSYGITPLHLACSCTELNRIPPEKRSTIVDVLLKAGARCNVKNKNNETPLHCLFSCTCLGKSEIAKLLHSASEEELKADDTAEKADIPLQKLCTLRSSSKLFSDDATKSINTIYTNDSLKKYFIDHISNFLQNCNVTLLAKVLEGCKPFTIEEKDSLYKECLKSENKQYICSWVVIFVVYSPESIEGHPELDISNDERHALLRKCITQINTGALRMSVLKMLVNRKCDVNAVDSEGASLFVTALKACKLHRSDMKSIIEHFIGLEADPNALDSAGRCPVHYCILSSADDEYTHKCIKLFMKYNKTNFDIGLLLHLAVQINRTRTKTIRTLPDRISPNQKDATGNAIHHLVIALSKYGRQNYVHTASFSALVERGVDINMYNEDGETPLHVAMKYNVNNEVIVEMLRNGADPNRKKRKTVKRTSTEGNEQDAASDIDFDNGKSPFQYLFAYCHFNSVAIVREMLKYDADVLQKDTSGQNTIHITTFSMNRYSLKVLLLLLNHVDGQVIYSCINAQDCVGNTPLHNVCTFDSEEKDAWCISLRVAMARVLVAMGARLDIRNNDGQTPFHFVICQYSKFVKELSIVSEKFIHNLVALIELFMANNADMEIRDNKRKRVVDLIAECELPELIQLISGNVTPEHVFFTFKSNCTKLD